MIKVEKTTLIEMNVEFKEIFDGATIEEATQKAHNQKSPKDDAKVNIASQRFLSAKIKPTSDLQQIQHLIFQSRPQCGEGLIQ